MQHGYFTNSTNVNNNFQSYHTNINFQKNVTKTLLFIGSSGSGKTAVINYLCCLDNNTSIDHSISKISGESVTQEVKKYRSPLFMTNNLQYQYEIFDTVGLGADDVDSIEAYQVLFMNIMFEQEIDLIVIVVKLERFRNKFAKDIQNMVTALRNLGASDGNFFLLLTHIDPWNEEVSRQFSISFKQKHSLNFISEQSTCFGCFANVYDVHSELQQKYYEWVNYSINRTRDWLLNANSQPFRPIVNVQKKSGIDYVKISQSFLANK